MQTIRCCFFPLLIALSMLTACSSMAPVSKSIPQSGQQTFKSERYGIQIRYPADLELHHTFSRSYLAADGWRTYMGPDAPPGQPLVALTMPASNQVTTGELRIGVSRAPAAVETCAHLPAAARPETREQVMIDGVPFTTFKARDAGMSHYLIVKSYRGVHQGTCYALDVLVFGTNPQVYEPPKKPPFSKKAVFDRLVPVALHMQFIESATSLETPVTYAGLLPCADCPGIQYQLNLLANHHFRLRLEYVDRNAIFDTHGRWYFIQDGTRLVLREADTKSSPRKWAVINDGQRLRMLGASGEPVQSELNFDLKRQTAFEPLRSMTNRP